MLEPRYQVSRSPSEVVFTTGLEVAPASLLLTATGLDGTVEGMATVLAGVVVDPSVPVPTYVEFGGR